MGQDKQQLAKLLQFVKAIYDNPANSEFRKGLRAIVEGDISKDEPHILHSIEKYLSLDFNIDPVEKADYSFIEEDYAREKLNADFREMLRYRFGTRGHKIDFAEFCRFAVLQIEMLVNYYYDKKYHQDISLIQQALLSDNSQIQFKVKLVSEIALKSKIYGLKKEFGWTPSDINVYLHSIDIRNRQSHRSLIAYADRIKETEDLLRAKGLLSDNGYIDYDKAQGIVSKKDLNEYKFEKWSDKMPFEEVTAGISRLSNIIKIRLI